MGELAKKLSCCGAIRRICANARQQQAKMVPEWRGCGAD
jgi:hypothetical protein